MNARKYMTNVRHLISMRSFGSIYGFTKTDIEVFINTLGVSENRLIDTNWSSDSSSRDFYRNRFQRFFSRIIPFSICLCNCDKCVGEGGGLGAGFAVSEPYTTSSPSMITAPLWWIRHRFNTEQNWVLIIKEWSKQRLHSFKFNLEAPSGPSSKWSGRRSSKQPKWGNKRRSMGSDCPEVRHIKSNKK